MKMFQIAFCFGLMTVMAASSGVNAQSARELDRKLTAIEKQLRAVQRRVFGEGGVPAEPQSQTAAPADDTRRLLADMAVKVGSVESQLRQLTGRLEQIEFEQRQLKQAMELLRKDTALRFEDAAANASAQAPAGVTTPATIPAATTVDPTTTEALPAAPVVALPDDEPAKQYQYAFSFVSKNDLESGRIAMEQFIGANPDDALVGNATYWLGRIHLRQNHPGLAAQQLLNLIEKFPSHKKMADALVDLADALVQLDSAGDACNALAEFNRVSDGVSPRLKQRAARISTSASCG